MPGDRDKKRAAPDELDGKPGHGRLTLRQKRGQRPRPARVFSPVFWVCFVMVAAAAMMLIIYGVQTARTRITQHELQTLYQAEAQFTPVAVPAEDSPVSAPDTPPSLGLAEAETAASPVPGTDPRTAAASSQAIMTRFLPLYAQNKDIAGWLKADGVSEIDFPVMQRDNVYYLTHDFYKRADIAGAAFLDAGNTIAPRDRNLIIHAHNMKNGAMFGKLSRLMNKTLLIEHPFFVLSTLYYEDLYVPYAISVVSTDPKDINYIALLDHDFAGGTSLTAYALRLKELSVLSLPADCAESDSLLTLITCHGDEEKDRLVIGLRRVRDNEYPGNIREDFRQYVTGRR